MQRIASAVWKGGPRAGSGTISSSSGTLNELPFAPSYVSDEHPCTNPCELLAAAHAACVTLAIVQKLAEQGHVLQSVSTDAILFMDEEEGRLRATKSYLDIRLRGTSLDEHQAQQFVSKVIDRCPISQILKASVEIVSRVEVSPGFSKSVTHLHGAQ